MAPTELDFLVDEVRLDAAAARSVVLVPVRELLLEPAFEPALADEREDALAPPRAEERAVVFDAAERDEPFAAPDFAADREPLDLEADREPDDFEADREPDFAAERDPDFEAVDFLAPDLADDFAADFLAPDFAPDFAVDFFAPDLAEEDLAEEDLALEDLVPDDFAEDFFAPDLAVDLALDFAADLVPDDFAADFFAPLLALDDFAADRAPPFADEADFLAPVLAALFAEPDFDEDVPEDFAAVRDAEPALFFAPAFAGVFRPLVEPRFALLLFADDEAEPLLPAPPVLISLVLDLSSVGIAASFKDLHVQPSRLHKATSLYQASSGYRKVSEVERVRFLWILLFSRLDRLASARRNGLRNQTHPACSMRAAQGLNTMIGAPARASIFPCAATHCRINAVARHCPINALANSSARRPAQRSRRDARRAPALETEM